jgi:hypothetical protein
MRLVMSKTIEEIAKEFGYIMVEKVGQRKIYKNDCFEIKIDEKGWSGPAEEEYEVGKSPKGTTAKSLEDHLDRFHGEFGYIKQ